MIELLTNWELSAQQPLPNGSMINKKQPAGPPSLLPTQLFCFVSRVLDLLFPVICSTIWWMIRFVIKMILGDGPSLSHANGRKELP